MFLISSLMQVDHDWRIPPLDLADSFCEVVAPLKSSPSSPPPLLLRGMLFGMKSSEKFGIRRDGGKKREDVWNGGDGPCEGRKGPDGENISSGGKSHRCAE